MSNFVVLDNAGSLSESDMALLTGTEMIIAMMRNRVLVVNENSKDIDWLSLTEDMGGLYHIRSIDGKRLYQLWFELGADVDKFKKNFMMHKLSTKEVLEDK